MLTYTQRYEVLQKIKEINRLNYNFKVKVWAAFILSVILTIVWWKLFPSFILTGLYALKEDIRIRELEEEIKYKRVGIG